MTMFTRLTLRTTDVPAAREFYAPLLAPKAVEIGAVEIEALPAPARARGAPAHWLAHVAVAALDPGDAPVLGPPTVERCVVRDPGGAVVALTTRAGSVPAGVIAWAELHSLDRAAAWAWYAARTPWVAGPAEDPGAGFGAYATLAPAAGAPLAGALLDSAARLPGIHPHWLLYFAVDDLDAALAAACARGARQGPPVRALGVGPAALRVVACDDPQGAAFGLAGR